MSTRWRAWRGHVLARGAWFPAGWGPAPETRTLARWEAGAELRRLDDGLLLTWSRSRRVEVATLEGLVLVERGGGLAAIDGPTPGPGELVLATRTYRIADLPLVDLADSIELPMPIAVVVPLGAPPAPLAVPAGVDVRARLGFGEAPLALDELQAQLRRVQSSFLGQLVGAVRSWFTTPAAAEAGPPAPPSALQRFLWNAAGPLLSRLLGGRYQAWLDDLLQALDGDDFDRALRMAIPLGGESIPGGLPGWSRPTPRTELTIRGRATPASFSLGLGDDLFAKLREEYERILRKLMESERWDEVAFLLVELLHQPARAVDLLEKAGRFQLAAEIAESRGLAAERAVRLFLLAGREDEAIRVARHHEAYAAAITLLTKGEPDLARTLRRAWAAALDRGGDPGTAIDVLLADAALHPLARAVALRLIRDEAPGHEAQLAWLLDDTGANLPLVLDRLRPVLDTPGPDAAGVRWRLAAGLARRQVPGVRAVQTRLARRMLVDLARGEGRDEGTARVVVQASGNTALGVDLALGGAPRAPGPVRVEIAAAAGLTILDTLPLADGSALVATGETGTFHVSTGGRIRAHFDEPCHELVGVTGDTSAIGITRRSTRRCFRIDLLRRRVELWRELGPGDHDHEAPGGVWFVADGDCVVALDLADPQPRAMWKSLAFKRPPKVRGVGAHVVFRGDAEDWAVHRPGFRLVARTPVGEGAAFLDLASLLQPPAGGWQLTVQTPGLPGRKHTLEPAAADGAVARIQEEGRVVLVTDTAGQQHVWLDGILRAVVAPPDASGRRARAGHLAVWSGARLLVVDLAPSRLRTDVILRP